MDANLHMLEIEIGCGGRKSRGVKLSLIVEEISCDIFNLSLG